MKKYCTKCGKPFEAIGREVICPACKQAAAEETKRAAVLKAKRASWTGESVPVRISGRASTIIRRCGAVHNLPFAAALDALLKDSEFFASLGTTWEAVEPYRSHRRDKHATDPAQEVKQDPAQEVKQDAPQDAPQDVPQDAPQEAKPVKTAAKAASKASKATSSKASSSKASKASKATSSKATTSSKPQTSKVVIPFGDFPVVVR